jgi:hypothetical protein
MFQTWKEMIKQHNFKILLFHQRSFFIFKFKCFSFNKLQIPFTKTFQTTLFFSAKLFAHLSPLAWLQNAIQAVLSLSPFWFAWPHKICGEANRVLYDFNLYGWLWNLNKCLHKTSRIFLQIRNWDLVKILSKTCGHLHSLVLVFFSIG